MSNRCVYVVDDEEAIRRSMHLMLRMMGYDARTFESGRSFIASLPQLDRGCVLLDLRMPEMDGLEVQRRLSSAGADHSVVFMSGHGDLGVSVAAMKGGAIAVLEKPFPAGALDVVLKVSFKRLEDPLGYRADLLSAAAALQALEVTELEVLERMLQGQETKHVAQQMGLAISAVELVQSRLFSELGVQSVAELLRVAYAATRARIP